MSEIRRLSVKRKQIEIILDFDGKEEKCTVREMLGSNAEDYMELNKDKFDFEVGENNKMQIKTVKTFKGIYSDILKHTLYHENNKLFTAEEIGNLPSSVQKELNDIAQELNAVTEKAKDEAKND